MHKNLTLQLKQAFAELVFEEERHLYWLRAKPLISVSKKVEGHAEKFVPEKYLPNCAKKASREEGREVTELELAHRWQTKNKDACQLGHETHYFLEMYNGLKTPVTPQEKAGVKFFKYIFSCYIKDAQGNDIPRYTILVRELRMYSYLYQYAGTMDLPLYDNLKKCIIVVDYKTNGDLFKTYGMLKAPFDYLESHPYNKYQLQLSYYQIMLEEKGFKVGERWVVHLQADGDYKIYEAFDLTVELKHCMNKPKEQPILNSLW